MVIFFTYFSDPCLYCLCSPSFAGCFLSSLLTRVCSPDSHPPPTTTTHLLSVHIFRRKTVNCHTSGQDCDTFFQSLSTCISVAASTCCCSQPLLGLTAETCTCWCLERLPVLMRCTASVWDKNMFCRCRLSLILTSCLL